MCISVARSRGPGEVAPHFLYRHFDSRNVLTGGTLVGRYVLISNPVTAAVGKGFKLD